MKSREVFHGIATAPVELPPTFVTVKLRALEELKNLSHKIGSPILEWIERSGHQAIRHWVVLDAPKQVAYTVLEETDELDENTLDSLIDRIQSLISKASSGLDPKEVLKQVDGLLSPYGTYLHRTNLIPSQVGGTCQRLLIVVPELVGPLWEILGNRDDMSTCLQFDAGPSGDSVGSDGTICCALCMAWRHVQSCYSSGEGWMNSVVYVVGNEETITEQRAVRAMTCFGERDFEPDLFEEKPKWTCWRLFVRRLSELDTLKTSHSSGPSLFLNKKRIL